MAFENDQQKSVAFLAERVSSLLVAEIANVASGGAEVAFRQH